MKRIRWIYYHIKTRIGWRIERAFGSYFGGNYAHRKIASMEEGNKLIYDLLKEDKPCCIARFGRTELTVLVSHEWDALGIKKPSEKINANLCQYSGFFPNVSEKFRRFYKYMLSLIGEVDVLGIWYMVLEEYMVDTYMKNTKVVPLMAIEPYYFDNPWSRVLEGKKVLVIHPFAETIESQYKKRKEIFPGRPVLPDFELKTIKAVQTLADQEDDRFNDWFEALDYMIDKMHQTDFDVAIIGCGAYGMPLAVEAKRMGKKAVHMGGATQVLFGIKGARWDNDEDVNCYYTDAWVRPGKQDELKGMEKVEDSCYW